VPANLLGQAWRELGINDLEALVKRLRDVAQCPPTFGSKPTASVIESRKITRARITDVITTIVVPPLLDFKGAFSPVVVALTTRSVGH
jgi:hypothetical protein